MKNKLSELRLVLISAKKQNNSLQRRLALYFVSIVLAAFGALVLVLAATGVVSTASRSTRRALSLQQANTASVMNSRFDALEAQGINLSRRLALVLGNMGTSAEALNDDEAAIARTEQTVFEPLYGAMQTADCSGVYFVMNATVNSSAPEAESSRCGVYLRYANVRANNKLNPYVMLFRGMAEVARQNDLELHNRWNLEMNIDNMPGCRAALAGGGKTADYYWTERVHLPDTWEDVILLCVPVRGADGSVMGVCGFELSALYFQLTYPATETEYGPMIAVLAPEEDGAVCTADGISGGDDGLLGDTELLAAGKGEGLATFTAEKTSFVGTAQEMKLPSAPDSAGEQWTLLTLLPKADYEAYARSSRIGPIAASLGFLLVMLAVSFLLSVKYVRPIVSGLEAVQTSGGETPGNTGIAEIDELYRFLRNRAEPGQMTVDGLPAGIKAMFDSFIQHSYTLTDAERTIFLYYIDGVQIQDIPDLIYTSMSTVRKHNRSIYDKLGVAGKDEMMLYIELIRRCGRLQELYDVPPGKK